MRSNAKKVLTKLVTEDAALFICYFVLGATLFAHTERLKNFVHSGTLFLTKQLDDRATLHIGVTPLRRKNKQASPSPSECSRATAAFLVNEREIYMQVFRWGRGFLFRLIGVFDTVETSYSTILKEMVSKKSGLCHQNFHFILKKKNNLIVIFRLLFSRFGYNNVM